MSCALPFHYWTLDTWYLFCNFCCPLWHFSINITISFIKGFWCSEIKQQLISVLYLLILGGKMPLDRYIWWIFIKVFRAYLARVQSLVYFVPFYKNPLWSVRDQFLWFSVENCKLVIFFWNWTHTKHIHYETIMLSNYGLSITIWRSMIVRI